MAEQSTQSIVVAAPAADVMAVIADFEAYPQWVKAARTVEVLQAGPDGRASRVRFVIDATVLTDEYVLDYSWDGDPQAAGAPGAGRAACASSSTPPSSPTSTSSTTPGTATGRCPGRWCRAGS